MTTSASSGHRHSGGTTFSPLAGVALILVALAIVEVLFAARFWIQLNSTGAENGMAAIVLDATKHLVAPFSGAGEVTNESIGTVDRATLLAAIAYVGIALALIVLVLLISSLLAGSSMMSDRRRRSVWRGNLQYHPEMPQLSRSLLTTAFVGLTPGQAARALRMMQVDRFQSDVVVIPADGGSMVAVFAPDESVSPIGRLQLAREAAALGRILKSLAARFEAHSGAEPVQT